jgi:hypothetical protein
VRLANVRRSDALPYLQELPTVEQSIRIYKIEPQITVTTTSSDSFGPNFPTNPNLKDTHTAILLHGRESSGEEIADELFAIKLSNRRALADKLPS